MGKGRSAGRPDEAIGRRRCAIAQSGMRRQARLTLLVPASSARWVHVGCVPKRTPFQAQASSIMETTLTVGHDFALSGAVGGSLSCRLVKNRLTRGYAGCELR